MNLKSNENLKAKTLCFSGHRPEKLPNKGDLEAPETKMLLSILFNEIEESLKEGYKRFITGVAKGIDLWAAKYIIELKQSHPDIKLICAVPYEGYGKAWKGLDKWDLNIIFEKADEIITVSPEYSKFCMKKRNEYMVDNSSKLIAVVSDYRSGTGQTIRYAEKMGLSKKIINANEIYVSEYI